MKRRAAVCIVALVSFAGLGVCADDAAVGRPVRVVSLSFNERPLDKVLGVIEQEAAKGADLLILPETFTGHSAPETLDGKTIAALAVEAKKYHTYIVCPLDRMDGATRYNTAVLLDREGKIAGTYNKVYPYWSEFDLKPPVTPGKDVPVFNTDFGRLGIAICFDVNFPDVWDVLAEKGAELVVWPSAYSAGTSLQAHALNHHYYIVTSTLLNDCIVYDITGEELLNEKTPNVNIARITLDLDRGIYHQNFNTEGRRKLLKEHAADVVEDKWLDREQWFVLKAVRPGVSARALAKQYGLEELRDYKARSQTVIDKMRGQPIQPRPAP